MTVYSLSLFTVSAGGSSHLHDLHHWTAYSVCRDRTDIQGPQESQCSGRHLSPAEVTYRTLIIHNYCRI